ncbi:MAG: theronine dehydrogenase [Frankiales bacterium]|nr:theronine dehydrogenase [Frankiales bacterium]
MKALTVRPEVAGSAAVEDVDLGPVAGGEVDVETLLVGICGTEAEIVAGEYGEAPEGSDVLVLGHESLGRVAHAPDGSALTPGDLVVPMVRWPDPVPCEACAAGEWDMCRNGRYTEHGIAGRHGFARERYGVPADRLVAIPAALGDLGVLVEPASVLAKAWEQTLYVAGRGVWTPKTVLVTGAGPIGLLAAMIGVQKGFDVHVLDKATDGPKPELVRDLGASYTSKGIDAVGVEPDIVIECTGVGPLIFDVLTRSGRNGITCLTGVSSPGARLSIDPGAINREIVLENDVVFGSVNANRRHYEAAVAALVAGDAEWLSRLLTRRVPLERFAEGLEHTPDDVKVVLTLQD